MNEELEEIAISPDEVGHRLDKVLANRFETIKSRTYFQNLIDSGHITVNSSLVKKGYKVALNDEIAIHFVVEPEIGLNPENIPLRFIFEDEHLLIIDKPAGMVVHPAAGNWSGTFVNALLYHCQTLPRSDTLRPGIVHRLDKDTSGLLIAAKTTLAHQRLVEMFSQRKIYKEYLVICLGNPGTIEVNAPIGRHPIHRKQMTVIETGKHSLSYFETIKSNSFSSQVKVILKTGRTHQIRVHLKHLRTPVLGDSVYGNSSVNLKYGIKRQLLHAHKLSFSHPITEEPLSFVAPIPEDMLKFC